MRTCRSTAAAGASCRGCLRIADASLGKSILSPCTLRTYMSYILNSLMGGVI